MRHTNARYVHSCATHEGAGSPTRAAPTQGKRAHARACICPSATPRTRSALNLVQTGAHGARTWPSARLRTAASSSPSSCSLPLAELQEPGRDTGAVSGCVCLGRRAKRRCGCRPPTAAGRADATCAYPQKNQKSPSAVPRACPVTAPSSRSALDDIEPLHRSAVPVVDAPILSNFLRTTNRNTQPRVR